MTYSIFTTRAYYFPVCGIRLASFYLAALLVLIYFPLLLMWMLLWMLFLLCVLVSLWFPPFDAEPILPLISPFICTAGMAPSGKSAKTDPLTVFWPTDYIDLCFYISGACFCHSFCLKIIPLYHKIKLKVTFLPLLYLIEISKIKFTSIFNCCPK